MAPELAWLQSERVLFVGDSLLAGTLRVLDSRLNAMGIDHRIAAVSGSGLSEFDHQADWLTKATDLVSAYQPTVVVAGFCCNYRPPYPRTADGEEIHSGTAAFRQYWSRRARRLARRLTADGAELWWTITPPSDDPGLNAHAIDPINDTTLEMANHPQPGDPVPRLIRWDLALTGGTGIYADSLPVDGATHQVRSDGLHFTPAGAKLATRSILDALGGARPALPFAGFSAIHRPTQFAMERFLGRDPAQQPQVRTMLGSGYRTGRVDAPTHMDDLLHSQAWGGRVATVVAMYRVALARLPDAEELNWWVAALNNSRSPADIATHLAGSETFITYYADATAADLTAALHANATGQGPDATTRARWSRALTTDRTPADLIASLAGSEIVTARTAAQTEALIVHVGLLDRLPAAIPAFGAPAPPPGATTALVMGTPAFIDAARAFRPFIPAPLHPDPGG